MTETEKTLWEFLRKNKVLGLRFRRQHPIFLFIVDFYCHALKLVIEIDGGYHKLSEQKEYDINRTGELENLGIIVLRFTNEQVDNDFKNVKQEIIKQCKTRRDELEKVLQ